MEPKIRLLFSLAIAAILLLPSCKKNGPRLCDRDDVITTTVKVFATGLNNPRGLKFGPDGILYVAEGGAGGALSTDGLCEQVLVPIGPYTGGFSARVSKISPDGTRTTVVDGLPSSATSPAFGGLI